jgi:phytoene dehydrogenase-like protein
MAPPDRHVLVARVQHVSNPGVKDVVANAVTRAIAARVPGFESTVLHRHVLLPDDIAREFGLTEGTVSHGEVALDQILFMRPVAGYGHHAMPVGGLYLGGAGAHPGPGVLGGAGWLAAREVLRATTGERP